jgi:diguanylate cyclase (GGDEF)-like protein/PAS domain S-box-containing protein
MVSSQHFNGFTEDYQIMKNKIQTKLILLLCLVILAFIVVLLVINNFEKDRAELLFHEQFASKELFFDKLVKLKQSSMEGYAYDYTYWDEMVDFVATGNRVWAKQNIDASLSTYKVDGVWVYNPNWRLVYSTHNEGIQLEKELPLLKSIYPRLFTKSPWVHFYINTPAGLLEINGASIHPSSDQERKTPTQGYFFAGRLWSPSYLKELAELTDSKLSLIPFKKGAPPESQDNPETGTISFSRRLLGWDNRPIFQISVTSESPIIQTLKRTSNQELVLLIGFTIVLLLVLIVFLTRWISSPLRLISRSLTLQNPEIIVPLQTDTTEFGHISKLITTFFAQNNQLVKEINERKQAELKLHNNLQFLQTLLDAIPSPVFYKNTVGLYLDCNNAYEKFMGLSKDQIIGQTVYGIAPKDLADIYFQSDQELLQHPGGQQYETSVRSADGSLHQVIFNKATYLNSDGEVAGIVGSILDITERKQAEETLRQSEERFKAQYHGNPIPTFTWRKKGEHFVLVDYNTAAKVITHGRVMEFIGKTAAELYQNSEQILQDLQRCFLDKTIIQREHQSQHFMPGRLLVTTYAFVPPDLVMVHIEDITERKRIETTLRNTEQNLRAIINSAPAAIFSLDRAGKVIMWNVAAEHIFGWKSEEVIGQVLPIVPEESQSEFHTLFTRLLNGENLTNIELRRQRKDRTLIEVNLSAAPLYASDGSIIGIMAIMADISERKQAEREVLEAQQRYEELVNNLPLGIYRNTPGPEGRFLAVNPAILDLFEADSKEEFMQYPVSKQYVDPKRRKEISDKLLQQGFIRNEEVELITFKGKRIWGSVSAVMKKDKDGQVYFDGVIRDITERKQAIDALRELSLTDDLTGLANRRGFMNLAEQQLKIADRLKQGLCLFFIDLDKMKWINDTLGHKEGDNALIDTANVLRTTFRAADIIGRIGGDEFVGLAIESKETTDNQIMARLQEHLEALNTYGKRPYPLSLSVGVAQYNPDKPCSLDTLLELGDKRMYEQKQQKGTARK